MRRLILLRHAQSAWNADGRMQGWADPPLSEAGLADAQRLGRHLRSTGLAGALSSDLLRARQTAEAVLGAAGLGSGVRIDARLRERDVGWVTGLDEAESYERFPLEMAEWRSGRRDQAPGGESDRSVLVRARRALDELSLEAVGSGADNGTLLVVTHGGVISVLERAAELGPGGFANLHGRWVLVEEPGRWRLGDRFGPEVVAAQ